MSAGTHGSSWRQLVAFAPLLGGAAIVMTLTQGEPEFALSRNVHFVLVPVCLLGWWVAWRLARLLSLTPVVRIAQAQAGYVALRGTARAMPNRAPLASPGGDPCVWIYRASTRTSRGDGTHASDSAEPFLLDDGSGQCIVLPAGAQVSGGQDGKRSGERLIVAGDPIYVTGEFKPVSGETLQQQQDVESAGIKPSPLALPIVCAPRNLGAFMIAANKDASSEQSWYTLLARVNLALLLGSGTMLGYLLWVGR